MTPPRTRLCAPQVRLAVAGSTDSAQCFQAAYVCVWQVGATAERQAAWLDDRLPCTIALLELTRSYPACCEKSHPCFMAAVVLLLLAWIP